MKPRYCVRVVIHHKDGQPILPSDNISPMWIEQLRYAGYVRLHRHDDTGLCFDLLCPPSIKGEQVRVWTRQNAERMQSFGINAVEAPEMP